MLAIPVLSIGGAKSLGNELGAQAKLIAPERPGETMSALSGFLKQRIS